MDTIIPQRRCTKCKNPLDHSGSGSYCKTCYATYKRERRKQGHNLYTSEQRRNQNYQANYGITREEYEQMFAQQGGVCAACGQPETVIHHHGKKKPLAVDHDHKTDEVRMLLCSDCNSALGYLQDNPDRIRALLRYIERFIK
jgi:hypothetical protein